MKYEKPEVRTVRGVDLLSQLGPARAGGYGGDDEERDASSLIKKGR